MYLLSTATDGVALSVASGSTEDIGALSLALQIIDASQELHQTVANLKKLMPESSPAAGNEQGQSNTTQGQHYLLISYNIHDLSVTQTTCIWLATRSGLSCCKPIQTTQDAAQLVCLLPRQELL